MQNLSSNKTIKVKSVRENLQMQTLTKVIHMQISHLFHAFFSSSTFCVTVGDNIICPFVFLFETSYTL
jgi:hypothetical protein